MTYWWILIVAHVIEIVAMVALVLSLHRYRDEYIAKRIVLLPVAWIVQTVAILITVFVRMAQAAQPPPPFTWWILFLSTLFAAIVASYLAGVFTSLWNGIGKPSKL